MAPGRCSFDTETGVLKTSIIATLLVALSGIILGLVSQSFSITFDGFFSLADTVMTTITLVVVQWITRFALYQPLPRGIAERFSMGFWHLEPLILLLSGLILMGVASFALLNAINSLLTGGREIAFGIATIYASITVVICFSMATIELRANRKLKSEFLKLDTSSWIISGSITAALLVAFSIGMAVQGTHYDWIRPYIDPAVLAVICVIIIPIPFTTVRKALRDVLLITPPELKAKVDEVAAQIVAEEGFLSFRSYVAKQGRARDISLYFIAPHNLPPRPLAQWDALRDRIGDLIGDDNPDRWLTITFTEDEEWT